MSLGTVLVVDDEPRQLEILKTILTREGYEVDTSASGEEALQLLLSSPPQVLLTDLKLPGLDGIQLLEAALRDAPSCSAVVMTAHGSVDTAVEAMKKGAFDYLTKPLDRERLLLVLGRAMETVRLRGENRTLRAQLHERFRLDNVVGNHGTMQDVVRLVEKVAPSGATVLIYGESGTGKELIARAIHYNSPRAARPFLAINCSAVPEPLLESEFFGHEKGSFTGAVARKLGLFEQASGGTFFLDEVGELPFAMQAKLLRALQEKEIRRVGGNGSVLIDVRIVAATNRDLTQRMKAGKFREDLYYRLNVFPIFLPALRERATDIPSLAEHFLARLGREAGKPALRVAPETLALLLRYRWPGNVRQLESALERAFLLAEGDILTPDLLPAEIRENLQGTVGGLLEMEIPDEGISLEVLERELLEKALRKAGGILTRAAKLLGISSRTLQYRLDKFGISRESASAPFGKADAPIGAGNTKSGS
ncbi:MAG TPA: sigma-54 dependent transcriptional regulator [Candidatus Polarisedimenticolia bacterium]|nr:sigma-54 dependent transcriptional regulator [Candidatus Polarisedimenticolia bacterium]